MFFFWAIIAILLIAALLFALPPFFRRYESTQKISGNKRTNITIYQQQLEELDADLENQLIDEEHHQKSQEELKLRLLEDVDNETLASSTQKPAKWAGILALVMIPTLSISLYLTFGSPGLLTPEDLEQQTAKLQEGIRNSPHAATDDKITEMVATLEARMEATPDDAEGQLMLARSYTFLKRYADAVTAYEKAEKLDPNNARLLVDYADAVAMSTGESLQGLPIKLITRALNIDPNNQKGLWLAGTAAYDSGNFEATLYIWARLYGMLEAGSGGASTMAANLKETRDLYLASGGSPESIPDIDALLAEKQNQPTGGGSVQGHIGLADTLKDKVSPSDTVFIFAKATSGPPMPVAIIRTTVDQLPMAFELSDANSVMPARKLSQLTEVIIGARISKTGNAMPQSGDIQTERQRMNTGAKGIQLVLDQVIP